MESNSFPVWSKVASASEGDLKSVEQVNRALFVAASKSKTDSEHSPIRESSLVSRSTVKVPTVFFAMVEKISFWEPPEIMKGVSIKSSV